MPSEPFYKGLTLAEQVEKLVDFHTDPKQRHLSIYEAQLLDRVRLRLQEPPARSTREAREELRTAYEAWAQAYETLIYGHDRALSVQTFRLTSGADPTVLRRDVGLDEIARDPSPRQVQAAVAAWLIAESSDLIGRYEVLVSSAVRLQRDVDDLGQALINRVLYQPTVVAENSWADVAPLLEHLANSKKKGGPVLIMGGTLVGTQNLLLAFLAGGSVIVLQMLQDVGEGMSPGLKALGERLTQRWRGPGPP